MKAWLLVLVTLATAADAQGVQESDMAAEAAMMRDAWKQTDKPSATVTLQLYERQLRFSLPRGYVPVYSARAPGQFLTEYVPDGETVTSWTTMITVRAFARLGAAPMTTAEIAERIYKPTCTGGPRFVDEGEAALGPALSARKVAFGCSDTAGAAYQGAPAGVAEHGAAYVARDASNIYAVAISRRMDKPQSAVTMLAPLGPVMLCADDSTPECRDARAAEQLRRGGVSR